MLQHLHAIPKFPARIVVLGLGFIGGAVIRRLGAAGAAVLGIGSTELDLLDADAGIQLSYILRPEDTLIIVSARAPVKSHAMLIDNIRMMDAVTTALAERQIQHILYISSDAVYADSDKFLTETSCAQPGSLHGVMHLTREIMLTNACAGALCILRPTLVYGLSDPHNGYGPNRFRRLALRGEDIVLFGEGEEQRDHVWIEDVAELVCRAVLHRSTGILNIATGDLMSFKRIAEVTVAFCGKPVEIRTSNRVGLMPHNGYRPFDAIATRQAFPDFRYTNIADGLKRTVCEAMAGRQHD